MGDRPNDERTTAEALQARLAAIATSSDDGIVSTMLDGTVESWNGAAERMFGHAADTMIGQSILRVVPPDRHLEEYEILARIRLGQRIDHLRTVRLHASGQQVSVAVSVSPIVGPEDRIIGATWIVRDMTRQDQLEARYEAIIASADDAIISKDLNGIVQSWNAGAVRVFGYSADEMIGRPLLALFPPERVAEEEHILERIRRGERVEHFETVRVHKSGARIDISATISPVRGPTGIVIGASKIARDITWIKEIQRERDELLRREQEARRESERVNRIKDEFLSTLSHELRTPLNAILGWSQVLQDDPRQLQRGLATIERNARVQAQLVDDLLDVSRVVAGKMRLEIGTVDLGEVVAERVDSLRPAAAAKQIDLVLHELPADCRIVGDARRLQQVVWNLLSNAVRYTPERGRVEVGVHRGEGGVRIEVADTGMGIDPQFLPQIFARFSQADSSSTRAHGGLGLGLAIVRHLVELHGGEVAATSAGIGLGATFVVTLPQREPPAEAPADREAGRTTAGPSPAGPSLAGTILVVDDNEDNRDLLAHVLRASGARVVAVASAAAALELLRSEPIDLLVSDIAMPDMDGFELLGAARERGHDLPAVAVTAFAMRDEALRALDLGFARYLAKPVDHDALRRTAAELLAAPPRNRPTHPRHG